MKNTLIISAFPGTGKTYICDNVTNIDAVEVEFWKYKDDLHAEYINLIKDYIGKVDYIFVATDPIGLKLLHCEGLKIILVYPENELREEYLQRYIDRDSPTDFIGAFMKYWNPWLDELKRQDYCKHVVMESGEYLEDFMVSQLRFIDITNHINNKLPEVENIHHVNRTDLYQDILRIISKLKVRYKNKDTVDHPTVARELEQYFLKIV